VALYKQKEEAKAWEWQLKELKNKDEFEKVMNNAG